MSNDHTNRSGMSPLRVDNITSPGRVRGENEESTNRKANGLDASMNLDKETKKQEAQNEVEVVKNQLDQ